MRAVHMSYTMSRTLHTSTAGDDAEGGGVPESSRADAGTFDRGQDASASDRVPDAGSSGRVPNDADGAGVGAGPTEIVPDAGSSALAPGASDWADAGPELW